MNQYAGGVLMHPLNEIGLHILVNFVLFDSIDVTVHGVYGMP